MSTTPYPLDHYDHNKAMTSILYVIPTIYLPKRKINFMENCFSDSKSSFCVAQNLFLEAHLNFLHIAEDSLEFNRYT